MVYREQDKWSVNYKAHRFGTLGQHLRLHPRKIESDYVACVGSCQTYGRYAHTPFPAYLDAKLPVQCLNLGFAGGGPDFFLDDTIILETINKAKLVVLQVMDATTVSTKHYRCHPVIQAQLSRVEPLLADRIAEDVYKHCNTTQQLLQGLAKADRRIFDEVVLEARLTYMKRMEALIAAISPPIVLLWFSERAPDEDTRMSRYPELPKPPQLLNGSMFNHLFDKVEAGVMCCSDRDLPQPIFNASGGRGWNRYYPSVAMHEDAADSLLPVVQEMLNLRIGENP